MDNNKIDEAALTKRVKTLVLQERYEEALKAFEDIDISKIKNISILCLVGEVYMGLKRYDDAEHILLRVYEKNSNTRRILDLLTTLYIDKGEYSEAEYYYKEFIGVASKDLHRYILRYRLDKGKGERLSVLIDTLEKLKDYEYIEEWAYELATLYDASGDAKKCIHECDEIVLWFGHGEYVDKAIALKCKLTGQPLPAISTVEQHQLDAEREAAAEREHMEAVSADMGIEGVAGADYEGSIDLDLIQRALDQSQGDADTNVSEGQDTAANETEASSADQAEATTVDSDEDEEDEVIQENELPSEMSMKETETEQPVSEKEEKSHIAQLFSSLMFGKSKEKKDHFDWSSMGAKSDEDESEMDILAKGIVAEENNEETPNAKSISTEGFSAEDAAFFASLMGTDAEKSEPVSAEAADEEDIKAEEQPEEAEVREAPENAVIEDTTIEDTVPADTTSKAEEAETDMAADAQDDDDDDEDEIIEDMEIDQDILNALNNAQVKHEEDEDEISDGITASDTVLDIFGSVTEVKSIKEQLAKTFTRFEDPELDHMDLLAPYDINFVVTGEDMSVKSQIAIGIAKALNTYGICDKNKLVRATANDLNGRDFTGIFNKLKGGCLIIEQAGLLNDRAAGIIVDFVQNDNQDVAIVLEGQEERLKQLFKNYPVLHSKFLNIIHIGKYNEKELVHLAEGYAKNKGYELGESASTALARLLRSRMEEGHPVNYEDIMAIIEEAISSLEKRNMKNLFMTVLDNKYEEAAMFMLQPEDFENINIPE